MLSSIAVLVVSVAPSITAVDERMKGESDPRACLDCIVTIHTEVCTSISFNTTILNCEDILSASGSAAGLAVRTFSESWYLLNSCEPHDLLDSGFDGGFLGKATADADNMQERYLSVGGASVDPGDPCGASFGFVADLGSDIKGPCRIEGSAQGYYLIDTEEYRSTFDNTDLGHYVYLETGVAGFSSYIEMELEAPLQISSDMSVSCEVTFDIVDGCSERGFGLGWDDAGAIPYVGQQVLYSFSNSSFAESINLGGVFGASSIGDLARLGSLADSGLVATSSSGVASLTGTVEVIHEFDHAGTYEVIRETKFFGQAAGDFNCDGQVDLADYDAVSASQGTDYTSLLYYASVDFDLDGLVSSLEYERAVRLLNFLLCPADFNGDGSLNFFDSSDFLAAYGSSLPSADWNGDSAINFFDVSEYLAAYNAGCDW